MNNKKYDSDEEIKPTIVNVNLFSYNILSIILYCIIHFLLPENNFTYHLENCFITITVYTNFVLIYLYIKSML
jgi:hypothetical protein